MHNKHVQPASADTLNKTLVHLADLGVVPVPAPLLEQDFQSIGKNLRSAVVDEIPAYAESGNPDILPELELHAAEQLREVRRLLAGGAVSNFEFVRAHAQKRAAQRFPLESLLHAYRCGHKVVTHWIRDFVAAMKPRNLEQTVSAIADFSIEYTNAISTIATAAYVDHTRAIAEADSDHRKELLNVLLSGYDESDGRVQRLLKRGGYLEQRQTFCVVLARALDPLEMEHPGRAQRLVEALSQSVAALPVRALLGVRDGVVTAVLSDARRPSGWTAPSANLAQRVNSLVLALGPAIMIGVSSDQPATAFIPRALHEATVALDFATVTRRVVLFSELPLRQLLLHRGGDYLQSALPGWTVPFLAADAQANGHLSATLRAYANADMNLLKTAAALAVHPNTLYARMRRINELTGLDCRRYHELTELLLAADCARR